MNDLLTLCDEIEALLPCPFCGANAKFGCVPDTDKYSKAKNPDAGGEYIECTNSACGASTLLIFPTMADAKPFLRERWNHRVAPLQTARREAKLRVIAQQILIDAEAQDVLREWHERLRAALKDAP